MANRLNFGKRYEDDHSYFENPHSFRFVELHQIGELGCEAGYEVAMHRQTLFEVTYIVSGKGTIVTDGRSFAVEENSVFVNTPGQNHAILADRGTPLQYCYLGFNFIGSYKADLGLERFYRSWNGSQAFSDKRLLVLFWRALEELHAGGKCFMSMVGAYVEQIVMQAYRSCEEQHALRPVAVDSRAGDAAFAVENYIDRYFRDVDDIRELAKHLGYSYTYLAHAFKKKNGRTIGEYILAKKTEEAKWLLRTGRVSVSQIAARFGYKSVQSFSNSFKKAVGISPVDYRASSEAKENDSDDTAF